METAMSDSMTLENASLVENPNDQHPIYSQRDLWYFRTSDGREVGPFRYRSEAVTGFQRLNGER